MSALLIASVGTELSVSVGGCVALVVADNDNAESRAAEVEAMMRLSFHSRSPSLRQWAAKWLLEQYGLAVTGEECAA